MLGDAETQSNKIEALVLRKLGILVSREPLAASLP